jgi:hypothetical protein
MVVIHWKDIHEELEEAIDACSHVGNTPETLMTKPALPSCRGAYWVP